MSHWFSRFPSLMSSNLHKLPISASFSTSTPKIKILLFDYLLKHQHLSPECASRISSSSTTDFLMNPKNADSVLNFFKESGFTSNQIEAIVQKLPRVLTYNLEAGIEPKFNVLKEFGFMPSDLAGFISASPWHLNCSADWFRKSILVVRNVLGPDADICSFFKNSKYRFISRRNVVMNLAPNVDYLKSCGICLLQIATHVCKYPHVYLSNAEKFKDTVERVDEMGVHRESKMFLYALRVMSEMSEKSWKLKLKLFRELGFSEQSILHAFRICPSAFPLSERKIKEATQLLLSVVDISYIARNPQLFSYSVDKRLRPRLRLLKTLESKNLLIKRPILTSFLQMTDAKFIIKYVNPYSDEIRDLYAGTNGSHLVNEKS